MPYRKHNPRTIVLPSGKGLLLQRLNQSVMGSVGSVDKVGCIQHMSHYRYYTVENGRITRKIREARR